MKLEPRMELNAAQRELVAEAIDALPREDDRFAVMGAVMNGALNGEAAAITDATSATTAVVWVLEELYAKWREAFTEAAIDAARNESDDDNE